MPQTDNLSVADIRPPLPEPQRERWQPLRIGLIELFHYDSEEFWFHDGHLLLRGNNGTGKSKVLSLTLPLLFDAQLRPARVEPDGDSGKKMAWNLLMGSYPRRIGYSWIEFGRRDAEGVAHYLTLGAGLSAVAGRAHVDSWFFLLEGSPDASGPRLGRDLWLTTAQRQIFTRERLREAITGRGQLFESGQAYRRAVDERLFHLGQRRYDALMDTLVQLRQPQLSKKPDEAGLSSALSESLPPLPNELLGDVAEALNQLEEDRNRLEETRQLQQAVAQFEQRYCIYTGMLARRQARELRQAQTGFDNASAARNQAQAALEQAQEVEAAAITARDNTRRASLAARERVDTLQADPANRDATQLALAEGDMQRRRNAAGRAAEQFAEALERLHGEAERSEQRVRQAQDACGAVEAARAELRHAATALGIDASVDANPLLALDADALADSPSELQAGTQALQTAVSRRRQDLVLLRQRHAEVDQRLALRAQAATHRSDADTEHDEALEQRRQADLEAEREGSALTESWSRYGADLVQLKFDANGPLQQLAAWAAHPEGNNPALMALTGAWQATLARHAARQAELNGLRTAQQQQRAALTLEQAQLLGGEDTVPLEPFTRTPGIRGARPGAPLWRLLDFHPRLTAAERAGLEAALEASGLLDAWLSPDGNLADATGQPLLDTHWAHRLPVAGPCLNDALVPSLPEDSPVPASLLITLLAGVAWGMEDRQDAESWISADGRFRLGALSGAWRKSEARYIGHTARERARQQRLQEIDTAIAALDVADADLAQQFDTLQTARNLAAQEYRCAPSDQALQTAIVAAINAGQQATRARLRLEQANARLREAEQALQDVQQTLQHDAADLRLPAEADQLPAIEQMLEQFDHTRFGLSQAAQAWQRDRAALLEQQQREQDARTLHDQVEATLRHAREDADQATVRFTTLQRSVGAKVDALLQALRAAREASQRIETALQKAEDDLRAASERRAVAQTESTQKEQTLSTRSAERMHAAERVQRFAASGLLAAALPELAMPEIWSIDPALNLARRIEQDLRHLADGEQAWSRVTKQVAEDLNELQRALTALGHQAVSEPNDWGFTVHIQYQNRAERPDTLTALLAEDIAQRSELLSAREREVLENHLQAEIAAEIQRLMRAADERVSAINEELRKRPTSTGVRYRLKWEPLSAEEGAPAGLDVARERLLNTSADLWSAEDRRAIGSLLQQRIAAERARADAEVSGGSLAEQLARALDYRYWHRFAVQRLQDGQWRKLSGPASSGERALGLTVPLFAAIASFYGHGASRLAPRLMLLDEAFAGIDDAARAHCMGLIREFDLDFVITSEREWACYAELPGVAICQLQRREGVDAVFVSRWIWDGRARRVKNDPDRRFPPVNGICCDD
ncbi:hypothetical protein ACG33_00150 [Steroidobacter denitrificans]|uniref:TIGR02680 family protein n=1 Tax=Steroidobacter denitrificans TaxID=465721 RepID=A0A127F533_STEDE|nr:hypothetical protein ACG33_00150 [Steroidobacter denitrificans]